MHLLFTLPEIMLRTDERPRKTDRGFRVLISVATLLTGVLTVVAQSMSEEPAAVIALGTDTGHVQGIAVEGDRLWVSSVHVAAKKGSFFEFDLKTGLLRRSVEIQNGIRYHPGGISSDATSIWVPVAEYRRASTTVIQRRNKTTLAIVSEFNFPDHIGCVAVTGKELVGGNWDARQLYVWTDSGEMIRKVDNPTDNAFQDLKFVQGQLVGSGLLPDKSGAIDWLEYPSLRPIRRLRLGVTDRNVAYTHEGMAITGDWLWLLPEDSPSRLFQFRLRPQ